MNKRIVGYLLMGIAVAVLCIQYYRYRVAPQFVIHDMQLTTFEGESYRVAFTQKKLCVIIFFTTWCGSCHAEFKSIERAVFNGAADGIDFIAVTDEPIQKLQNYMGVYGYDDITFLQSEKSVSTYGIRSFPTVYIYNDKGKLLYSKVGAIDWEDRAFISTLDNK